MKPCFSARGLGEAPLPHHFQNRPQPSRKPTAKPAPQAVTAAPVGRPPSPTGDPSSSGGGGGSFSGGGAGSGGGGGGGDSRAPAQVLPFWKHELFQAIVVVAGLVFGYIHVWQPSHDHRIATSASLASLQKGQSVLEKGLSVVEADVKEIKAGQSVLEMGQSVMEKSQSVVEADLKDIKSVLQAMQLSLAEQRGGSSSSSQAAMLDRLLHCRHLVPKVLAELAGSGSTALQLHAMTALCAFLQRQHAAGCTRQTVWALHGAVAALPGALHSVHGLMSSGSGGRLEETDMQRLEAAVAAAKLQQEATVKLNCSAFMKRQPPLPSASLNRPQPSRKPTAKPAPQAVTAAPVGRPPSPTGDPSSSGGGGGSFSGGGAGSGGGGGGGDSRAPAQVLPFWTHERFQAIVVVAGLVFGYIHVWQPSHDHRIATSASLASLQKGQSVLEKGLSVVEADVKEIKSVLQAMQLSDAEQRGSSSSSSSSQAAMLDRLLQCCGVGVIAYFCRTR
ncbi:hypothetical protein CHLNCDRAFT_139166 [Chlorella variabilis]|uniref:Uncharacterized protein n=1 Tax=Chlorella variabilis TaxID=554065 RepID=E1ZPL0_CHLVA|nr:hypothetical protein CHLNCDRAFT_139166 [Chlorella variabilis]EFN52343.1 hypothetical protein CHLNCDRAFT_139166 [Chlorella variabilis]|eukprot:XP_005844445.1 hypothetical protein CHLNCDRAFT_139166 [Chlorella variabilis]